MKNLKIRDDKGRQVSLLAADVRCIRGFPAGRFTDRPTAQGEVVFVQDRKQADGRFAPVTVSIFCQDAGREVAKAWAPEPNSGQLVELELSSTTGAIWLRADDIASVEPVDPEEGNGGARALLTLRWPLRHEDYAHQVFAVVQTSDAVIAAQDAALGAPTKPGILGRMPGRTRKQGR